MDATWIVAVALLVALLSTAYLALILLSPPTITFPPEDGYYVTPEAPTSKKALPSLDDEPTLDLTVVVPAYNEATRITPMLQAAADHLLSSASSVKTFEVLIINDGSKDATKSVALSSPKTLFAANGGKPPKGKTFDLRVVSLSKNRGKGAAVKHGVLHARGRRVLFVDADGASQFSDLELLWKAMDKIEEDGQAIAVGSRAHLVDTEAVVKRSFIRNLLMRGLHFTLKTLGVGHIRDTQCGFKLFTRSSARALFPPMHIAHWIFDVELLLLSALLGLPIVEVPIAWHEVSGSKINLVSDSIAMLRDLVVLRANYATGRWEVGTKAKRKKSE